MNEASSIVSGLAIVKKEEGRLLVWKREAFVELEKSSPGGERYFAKRRGVILQTERWDSIIVSQECCI
jgi:hypothetical protein